MIDNYDLYVQHEARQEQQLKRFPRCVECGEPIQSDYCYEVNDELICRDCMRRNHRKRTENYIDC